MNNKLSIIIVNRNTKQHLENCLNSIFQHLNNIEFEVYVVDNASGDGSADMVLQKFPRAVLICSEENIGFSRANNLAIEKTFSKYILLLNPDTLIIDDSIEKMIDYMDNNPPVGVLGPKLLNADLSLQKSTNDFPAIRNLIKNQIIGRVSFMQKLMPNISMEHWSYDYIRTVDCVTGACMMIRREVVDSIGGLDQNIFMYLEDVDYCLRAKKAGFNTIFYPEAKVIHLLGRTIDGDADGILKRDKMKNASREYFYNKHYGKLVKSLFDFVVFPYKLLKRRKY
jgi:GT2 family glycosyltransferase